MNDISEDTRIREARRIAVEKAIKELEPIAIFKWFCDNQWETVTQCYIYLPVDLQLIYMSERLNHVQSLRRLQ